MTFVSCPLSVLTTPLISTTFPAFISEGSVASEMVMTGMLGFGVAVGSGVGAGAAVGSGVGSGVGVGAAVSCTCTAAVGIGTASGLPVQPVSVSSIDTASVSAAADFIGFVIC